MDQHRQGGASLVRRLMLMVACLGALVGCLPTDPTDTSKTWPDPIAMAIYAVQPEFDQTLGADGDTLTIRWNDVTLADTTPTVTLTLVSDDDGSTLTLATGIDAVPDGDADAFEFAGRDVGGDLVPPGSYQVEYLIEDGSGGTDTDESGGLITVPLRFTAPTENSTVFQSSLEAEGVAITWDSVQPAVASRLDIGLVDDPNEPNTIQWATDPNGSLVGDGDFGFTFQGTVFSGTTLKDTDIDPNGQPIAPNTYSVVARIVPSGAGQVGYYIEAPGRLTIVADP